MPLTWKRFSVASTSATWEGGSWGVVVAVGLAIWCYCRCVVCRRWVDVVARAQRQKKYPINRGLQGMRGGVGVIGHRRVH